VRPLENIRVLDLSRMVAGPFCSMSLGDLGAEIIKIEHPGKGDDSRQWGPPFVNGESAYFLSVNRNKKSVTVDLKKEAGQRLILDLVPHCDVVLDNFRPGTMDKYNLSYERLTALKPDLIYCSITGYGLTGPDRDKPATDPILQARGGIIDLIGEPGGEGFRLPIPIIDITAGMQAYSSILAAIIDRNTIGKGHFIEVSLLDTELSLFLNLASNYLLAGILPKRYGNAHPAIVPSGVFRAKDCRVYLSASSDIRWTRLCRALGLDEFATDPRFKTAEARIAHRDDVNRVIQEKIGEKNAAEWIKIIESCGGGIPFSPVNTFDNVFNDPQVRERDIITQVHHPKTGNLSMIGIPVRYDGIREDILRPPPLLGEHTDEVLSQLLHYEKETVAELRTRKII